MACKEDATLENDRSAEVARDNNLKAGTAPGPLSPNLVCSLHILHLISSHSAPGAVLVYDKMIWGL